MLGFHSAHGHSKTKMVFGPFQTKGKGLSKPLRRKQRRTNMGKKNHIFDDDGDGDDDGADADAVACGDVPACSGRGEIASMMFLMMIISFRRKEVGNAIYGQRYFK